MLFVHFSTVPEHEHGEKFSYSKLRYRPLGLSSRNICKQFTNWMRRNKGDEVCNSANINFYYFLIIEKYFDMNKKNCKDGLDIYKKFITRMDRVSDFLKVAEDVGFDKDDIPDLSKVGRIKQQLVCRQQRNN